MTQRNAELLPHVGKLITVLSPKGYKVGILRAVASDGSFDMLWQKSPERSTYFGYGNFESFDLKTMTLHIH